MKQLFILLIALMLTSPNAKAKHIPPPGFVGVEGTQFKIDGKPYRFVGCNFWYGMHLGVVKHRARLIRELDQLQALGCNNLRIMVGSEGPEEEKYRVQPPLQSKPYEYSEELLEGLDFLLAEMAKRKIYGVLVFGNFWHWSGGFAQYLNWVHGRPIPYPSLNGGISWLVFMDYSYHFYSNQEAKACFNALIKKVVERTNTITGTAYIDEPAIMAWQLANEPKCPSRKSAYRNWIHETAKMIKDMDPNHLVSTGSEGLMSESILGSRRRNYIKNHSSSNIDYLTVHVWIQNWGWYNPKRPKTFDSAQKKAIAYLDKHINMAKKMKLPLVLEEFGIARDAESYEHSSGVRFRDTYYKLIFDYLEKNIKKNSPFQGVNFWAWAGEGRPRSLKSVYEPGDDLIGDPPHEYQGWYSVYDRDTSTLELIKEYNGRVQE